MFAYKPAAELRPDPGSRQSSSRAPLIWALLGSRKGDNSQVLALAHSLDGEVEEKRLSYSLLRRLPRRLRGARLLSLRRESRRLIAPPWPDVVIGVGYRSVPIARYIKRKSAGRTRIVQIGNTRSSSADLDLVLVSPQYAREPASNVVALPLPVASPRAAIVPNPREQSWLDAQPRPLRLVAIGGATKGWEIDRQALEQSLSILDDKRGAEGGSVVAVGSPRTDRATKALVKRLLRKPAGTFVEGFPRYPVLRDNADELYVTADSISMITEAILTGKPVGIIPVKPAAKSVFRALGEKLRLFSRSNADIAAFWRSLRSRGVAGSVRHPTASSMQNTLGTANEAVRRLFD